MILSSISWKGYIAAGRVSSLNLYRRRLIHFMSPSSSSSTRASDPEYSHNSPPLITNYVLTRRAMSASSSPWLMLPSNINEYKFYRLAEKGVVSFDKTNNGGGDKTESRTKRRRGRRAGKKPDLVGSSHGWLALFDTSEKFIYLSDPVSGRNIKLPPVDTLPINGGAFLMVDGEVVQNFDGGDIANVVISCSPDDEEECRAMMIYGSENMLAFCCPGRSVEWTPIGNVYEYCPYYQRMIPRRYDSVVYSSRQKLFFSVTATDEFEAWDLISDPRCPRRISMADVKVDQNISLLACEAYQREHSEDVWHRQFLVVADHSDELFLVRQFVMYKKLVDVEKIYDRGYCAENNVPHKTVGFGVHRYDPIARTFNYIDMGGSSSLDGLALFIGLNHGFALRADEYPELKPNSIYFTDRDYARESSNNDPFRDDDDDDDDDDEKKNNAGDFGRHEVGIFNYQDGTFSPCYPSDYGSIQNSRPVPTWFTPNSPL